MTVTRRDAMQVSIWAMLCLATPVRAQEISAVPVNAKLEEVIAAFTEGDAISNEGVILTVPELAEDGYRVPVEIDAPEAQEILLIAPGNPVLPVLKARFGPLAGSQKIATRMRLAETQDVLALARLPEGSLRSDRQPVSVVVGGCA
ncbi:thiosulfate oxidation carrier protein SoxY [Rhodobacteraceae bacterium B1Z28]|uniref:Thiosulfate oxidation carrier protein SoxY n=1 Tax=Ruegeria haliotis TaxID=2747601 RepID=A0ABX2PRI0_9RHOB|nr:thiosulfate oxidation carrier protein SoxY [Ruegeria haliotis]NVO56725.1 thiosulfate oxidation carrier protein SoxY [Ruegeria haliotis]